MIRPAARKIFAVTFNIGVPATVITCSLLFYRQYFWCPWVVLFSALVLLAFAASLVVKGRWGGFLKSLATAFNITYVVLELLFYFLWSFDIVRPDIQFFFGALDSSDCRGIEYDQAFGYKCLPGHYRYVSVKNGNLEMDHGITINRQGCFSVFDYSYKKTQPRIKRYLVLGDSYSSGLVVSTTWCDRVQTMFTRCGNDSTELYNFSVDGSGIQNWHQLFFQELLPKYEFDGVIIAASSEKEGVPDFDRKFIMGQSAGDVNYIQSQDISETPPPEKFAVEQGAPISHIYPSAGLDSLKNLYLHQQLAKHVFAPMPPNLYFLKTVFVTGRDIVKLVSFVLKSNSYSKPYKEYAQLSNKPYQPEYFDNRYKYGYMLKHIIAACKTRHKEVLLLTIPDYKHTLEYVNHRPFIYRNEHRFLAEYYNLKYVDGFEIFKGMKEQEAKKYFYHYDWHWNQQGADLFAQKIVESRVLED